MPETHSSITVEVGGRTVPLDAIVERYERGEYLDPKEIDALLEWPATGVDVAEWRRLKAKVMFGANPFHEDDQEAEEAVVELLRDIFGEHGVETAEDYNRLLADVGDDHAVHDAVECLTGVVTPFEEEPESALDSFLSEREEQPVEELYRPEDAGEDWHPSKDQGLHEFIALTERASEKGEGRGGLNGGERWQELKEKAEFDPEEWGLENHDPDAGR